MPQPGRRDPAFTLIELLVVIAILGGLVAIVLPALGGARRAGSAVVCASNLRQMTSAALGYALDHDDTLPSANGYQGTPDAHASWFFALADYLACEVEQLARCPDDTSSAWETPALTTGYLRRTSYATSFYLSGRLPGYEQGGRLALVERPVYTAFGSELAESGSHATSDHFHAELWLIDPPRMAGEQLALTRHEGACHWAFLDGHVASHPLTDVYQLDPRSRIGELIWIRNRIDPRVAQ